MLDVIDSVEKNSRADLETTKEFFIQTVHGNQESCYEVDYLGSTAIHRFLGDIFARKN